MVIFHIPWSFLHIIWRIIIWIIHIEKIEFLYFYLYLNILVNPFFFELWINYFLFHVSYYRSSCFFIIHYFMTHFFTILLYFFSGWKSVKERKLLHRLFLAWTGFRQIYFSSDKKGLKDALIRGINIDYVPIIYQDGQIHQAFSPLL